MLKRVALWFPNLCQRKSTRGRREGVSSNKDIDVSKHSELAMWSKGENRRTTEFQNTPVPFRVVVKTPTQLRSL